MKFGTIDQKKRLQNIIKQTNIIKLCRLPVMTPLRIFSAIMFDRCTVVEMNLSLDS